LPQTKIIILRIFKIRGTLVFFISLGEIEIERARESEGERERERERENKSAGDFPK
jgi:hypothetical protein